MIVPTRELCEIFRVTDRSVTDWITEGMPTHKHGGHGRGDESLYDVGDVHVWLLTRAVARARQESPDARLRDLQAQHLEMRLARDAQKLVAVEDVEAKWTAAVVAARGELATLAERLKGRLDAAYRVNVDPALIESEVLPALNKLAQSGSHLAPEDEPAAEPAAFTDPVVEEKM